MATFYVHRAPEVTDTANSPTEVEPIVRAVAAATYPEADTSNVGETTSEFELATLWPPLDTKPTDRKSTTNPATASTGASEKTRVEFETFVRENMGQLLILARGMTGSLFDAQDLVHDVLVDTYQA